MNNTLYEITDKYLKVLDNLEIDEETGEILNAEELDELSGAFEEKSEAVACYIKNSEVFIGNLKAEEANLAKRRKQTEKHFLVRRIFSLVHRISKSCHLEIINACSMIYMHSNSQWI